MLKLFENGVADKMVHEIELEHVEAFLQPYKPVSRRSYTRSINAFVTWCKQRRMCAENPCEYLGKPLADNSEILFLNALETAQLLRTAIAFKKGRMVAPLAIGFFAGLRPSEIAELRQGDFRDGFIHVTGGKLRRKLARKFPIVPLLDQWLQQYPFQEHPSTYVKDLMALRKLVQPENWCQDIVRHTSITYQMERDKDAQMVALNCGTSPQMLNQHYLQVLEVGNDADLYWNLTPDYVMKLAIPEGAEDELKPKQKTVNWPDKATLQTWVKTRSLVRIGKDLGVSDNAVRKHCKKMEIDLS
ncbi:MAG: site-specific integrase [Verrucomicrobia bacterium]|nr:site-specific integrase [Verrucomicrobiota bacterium]